MKICVLGGTYFIGRRIASLLIQRGHEVFSLNRGTWPPLYGATGLAADRGRIDELRAALEGHRFDVIVDVSGQAPEHVENVINALEHLPPRVIYISSGAVYLESEGPFREDSPVGRADIWGDYGAGKLRCEKIWEDAAAAASLSLLALRPPYLYGLGNPLDRESWFVSRVLGGRTIFIPDDPGTRIQFLHVDDLALIVAGHLELSDGARGIYNVAAPDCLTFGLLCELTGRALCREPVTRVVDTVELGIPPRQIFPFRNYSYELETTKMREELLPAAGMMFPDSGCGWVETCVALERYAPISEPSQLERQLHENS